MLGKPGRKVIDVAIAGGGVIGHVLAVALARSAGAGFEVAAIAPPPPPAGRPAQRAIALGRGSVALLGAIGIWPAIAGRAQAMERIIVTDGRPGGSQLSLLEFADGAGGGAEAQVIEEDALAAACAAAAADAGVRLIADRVTGYAATEPGAALDLASGGRIGARLAVGADGRHSVLRRAAGIKTVGWSYGQSALVARVGHERDHCGVAVERFLPAGPFAVLPLSGRASSLVWTEADAEARRLAGGGADNLRTELEARWDRERGRIGEIGPVATFPLAFHVARRFAGPRLALAGEAAHQVHPLAGQGLNLGLRDVAALTEIVVGARRLGLDHGTAAALERYERWRRFDTISSALAYDGLNRLFSNDHDGLRLARDLGLGVVDRLGFLKRAFMREGAGLAGTVPRLMTGEAV
jgi:2-octaprenyl-6-methoxyphenol hydroxylase